MAPRPATSRILTGVFLCTIAATTACGNKPVPPAASTTTADEPAIITPPSVAAPVVTVQGVIDGRTVLLSDGTRVQVKGLIQPGECWAAAATAFAKAMLLDKPVTVSLAADGAATLLMADGADYGLLALEMGQARTDTADDSGALDAQLSAERGKIGLWGPPCSTTTASLPADPSPKPAPTKAPNPPAAGCTVAYRVTTEWPGGFRTDVTVGNTGSSAVEGWALHWTFPNDQAVTQMWNARSEQSGKAVTARNESYNTVIAPGASVLLGFTGASHATNTAPGDFTLNGHRCEIV